MDILADNRRERQPMIDCRSDMGCLCYGFNGDSRKTFSIDGEVTVVIVDKKKVGEREGNLLFPLFISKYMSSMSEFKNL